MRPASVSCSWVGDQNTCHAPGESNQHGLPRPLPYREVGIRAVDVPRVRETTDLVALAGEHIALKRVGRSVTGLCPFHTEKSPSFSISPEKNVWYCFGCQKS